MVCEVCRTGGESIQWMVVGREHVEVVGGVRWGFPGASDGKESACNAGDPGLISRSLLFPGEGNGYPLQVLAWRIPWTEEPGGLQSMGWQRVGQGLVTNAHMHRRGGFYFHY